MNETDKLKDARYKALERFIEINDPNYIELAVIKILDCLAVTLEYDPGIADQIVPDMAAYLLRLAQDLRNAGTCGRGN